MRLKTTTQQTPPTSNYSTVTAAPPVATSVAASTTTTASTRKSTPRVAIKRRKKISPARVFLWATFLTPLVLLGSYLIRPAPRVALIPRTEIVSQNGQMFARRIVSPDGFLQLAVGRVGEKPLWTEDITSDGVVALSPTGRYLVTGQVSKYGWPGNDDPLNELIKWHAPPTETLPEYTLQCRDTVTQAEVWKRFGPASNTTMPIGPSAVTVSPDGAHVAMAVEEGIRIHSLQSGEFESFVSTLPKKLDPDVQLSYSSDGQRIIAAQSRGIDHWDITARK
ncbi:hypothetical protein [Armatimonas sp.]|uniref:hypothetical protein n=1 Tax=Armatimonas sp. TaxID=1872638 RepID=UPI00286C7A8D|nr:hypothetical protein [Armatimonas sp.]